MTPGSACGGRAEFEAAPHESVAVYGPARSVVDAMRLRHRMGETLALGALGRYLRRYGQAGVAELEEFAVLLGVAGPVQWSVKAVLA
jgi:hypothetical protein